MNSAKTFTREPRETHETGSPLLRVLRVLRGPFLFAAAALLFCGSASAVTLRSNVTATITITNQTTNGMVFIIDGVTRTWSNSISGSPGTLILATNSAPKAATNLYAHLSLYKFTGPILLLARTNATNVVLQGQYAQFFTVTATNYASVSYVTNIFTNSYPLMLPLDVEPSISQRTNAANDLAAALNLNYGTTLISTGLLTLTNFLDRNSVQTASNKTVRNSTFQGVVTNAQLYATNGYLTNLILHAPKITNGVNYGNAFSSPGTNGTFNEQFGTDALATNNSSTAVGYAAVATGLASSALGAGATALGTASTALGQESYALTNNATAVGAAAEAWAIDSLALGAYAFTAYTNSVALGANTTTTASNQIRLGNAAHTVSIPGTLRVSLSAFITNLYALGGYSTNVSFTGSTNWDTRFNGTNQIAGALDAPKFDLSTLANGNNIGVNLGTSVITRITGTLTADSSLCGVVNGRDGAVHWIENASGYTITLAQNTSDPTPANRFSTYTSGDLSIITGGWAMIAYDSTASRWKIKSIFPSTALATNALATSGANATNLTVWPSASNVLALVVTNVTGQATNLAEFAGTNASLTISSSGGLNVGGKYDPGASNAVVQGRLGVKTSLTLSNVTASRLAVINAALEITNGAAMTNGQLIIGNANGYSVGTLTAGGGLVATNGAGTLALGTDGSFASTNYVRTNSGGPLYHIGTQTYERWHALGANGHSSLSTGTVMTNGNHRAVPFYSGRGGKIDYLGATVITAVGASTFRLGIYETLSATNIFPGALLVDSGSLSGATAIGVSNAVSAVLEPGRVYWAVTHASAAIATRSLALASMENIMGWTSGMEIASASAIESVSTFGALPSTFPLTNVIFQTGSGTMNPVVMARFSNSTP